MSKVGGETIHLSRQGTENTELKLRESHDNISYLEGINFINANKFIIKKLNNIRNKKKTAPLSPKCPLNVVNQNPGLKSVKLEEINRLGEKEVEVGPWANQVSSRRNNRDPGDGIVN